MARYRLKGASEVLWDAYPEQFLDVAQFVTELGGAEGIILLLAVLFWLLDREKVILVAAITVAGVAFVLVLKSILAMPRPIADPTLTVEAVVELSDDEYGFPSGHAFNAVVVYGGLLYFFEKYRDLRWTIGVGILVLSISLTRVFLRLHYLGDLLVGAVLGILFLLGMDRVMNDDARTGFGIGILLGIVAVAVSGNSLSMLHTEEYALTVLGIAIGGTFASVYLDRIPELRSRVEGAVLTVAGTSYIVLLLIVYSISVGSAGTIVDNVLIVLFHSALIVGVLFLPFASHQIVRKREASQMDGVTE